MWRIFPRRLLFLHEIPQAVFVVLFVIGEHQGMEQVAVEIPGAGALKADLELAFCFCRAVYADGGVQLRRQHEAFSRVAVDQHRLHGLFRTALVVDVGGIEIPQPRGHERVDHLRDRVQIHFPAALGAGQAHQAEAELRNVLGPFCFLHRVLLLCLSSLFIFFVYFVFLSFLIMPQHDLFRAQKKRQMPLFYRSLIAIPMHL
jgi:hypothetical protein